MFNRYRTYSDSFFFSLLQDTKQICSYKNVALLWDLQLKKCSAALEFIAKKFSTATDHCTALTLIDKIVTKVYICYKKDIATKDLVANQLSIAIEVLRLKQAYSSKFSHRYKFYFLQCMRVSHMRMLVDSLSTSIRRSPFDLSSTNGLHLCSTIILVNWQMG